MRLVDQSQAQRIDHRTQSEYGIRSEQLINTAAEMCFQYFIRVIQAQKHQSFLFLIGPGHNGKDGLLFAEKLKAQGFEKLQTCFLNESGQMVFLEDSLQNFDYIIDALFGIGLSRPLQPELCEFILKLNAHSKRIYALDIPSGLHASTGKILGACVKASLTINFGPCKLGQWIQSGPDFCGKIIAFDVGFPMDLIRQEANEYFAIGRNTAQKLLPQRGRLSNKSNGGRVLVIAGSQNMMGAALLAARASLRAGAGYVTVMPVLPESTVRDYNSLKNNPEVLWKVFDLNQDWNQFDAILIGPGLGFEAEDPIKKLIQSLLNINYPWVILDADALTICSRNFQDQKFPSTWVITPHDAEMAKLIPRSIQNIQESRLECLRAAVKKWNATFVLKGSRSLIASQNKVFVNLSGNSALAKSGTGDVLSGIILAMLAQMKDVAQATCLSVYVHGRISDEFVREGKDHLSLLPTDLIEKLPQVLFDIRKGQVQNTRIQNGKNK